MERQIKFRGRNIHTGEWVVGDLLHIAGGCLIYFGSDTDTAEHDIERSNPIAVEFFKDEIAVVDPDSVGQFTGMLDKNGKEIYEGDVVLQQAYSGKKPMLVRFEHGAFVTGEHSGSSTAIRPMLIQKRCEVLGNIYDNPELISKRNENKHSDLQFTEPKTSPLRSAG